MKFAYVAQMGFGELSQAESFALHTREKGVENVFITDNEGFVKAMTQCGFPIHRVASCDEARKLIQQINPDVLFHCNSKTTHMYPFSLLREPPLDPKPLVASFDSNWLWLKDSRLRFQAPDWLDVIFVVMPQAIYEKGLRKNGGHYEISDVFRDKIVTPGFIPSGHVVGEPEKADVRRKLGLTDEKLVFTYFGLKEKDLIEQYIQGLDQFVASMNAKVFVKRYGSEPLPQRDWLVEKDWLTVEEMVAYIAASDLVVQHHGLGNLPKVIRNQVPALCVTEGIPDSWTPDPQGGYPSYQHSAYFEIKAFRDCGLCRSIDHYDFEADELKANFHDLLCDEAEIEKMKTAQATYFEAGEERAYGKLQEALGARRD